MNSMILLCFLLIFCEHSQAESNEFDQLLQDAGYIFIGEQSVCSCVENIIFLEFVKYLVDNVVPYGCNGYAIRQFGDTAFNDTNLMKGYYSRDGLEWKINNWASDDYTEKCEYLNNVTYASALLDVDLLVSGNGDQSYEKNAIFIQGETDTIVDLNVSLSIAKKIASYSPIVYIWDHSQNGDQTGLFMILTSGKRQNIIRSNPSLTQLINFAKPHLFPDFASIGCGNISSVPLPTVSEPDLPSQPGYCFKDIIFGPTDSTVKTTGRVTTTTLTSTTTTTTVATTTSLIGSDTASPSTPNPSKTVIIIIAVSSSLLVIVLAATVTIYCRKKLKNRRTLVEIIVKQHEMNEKDAKHLADTANRYQLNSNKLSINYDEIIGSGSTATVYKGFLSGSSAINEWVDKIALNQKFTNCKVAIKIPKEMNRSQTEQIMRELQAMRQIGYHAHVSVLLGWCFQNDLPSLVFELALHDLFTYLCKFRETPNSCMPLKMMLSVAWQVSNGMQYIATFNIVHRDLAARNILLYDGLHAKISDFGLCCYCNESFTYQATLNKKLPVRWLSIEALVDRRFSEKSDVWAFGVLLYEMCTNGAVPYSLISNYEILEFLQSGKRLEKLETTNDKLYSLMLDCWNESVDERLSFADVTQRLQSYLEEETQTYGYLSIASSEKVAI